MSSPRRLKSFILADSDWRREPAADTADLFLSKVTSKHTETTHLVLMIRAFMAAEEWGRLKGGSPRRIHTNICWDKSKGTFKFEAVDEVVQHKLPSEIIAELDAIKRARSLFAPWAALAAATATFVEPEPMYPFRGVLFDADESEDLDETLSSPASSLFGAMTPLTELSEDDDDDESEGKGAPAADETGEPIGLGLTLHNEEQVLESSIDAQPCVERDAGPASTSAVGLGITLAEDAHAVDKQQFGRSAHIEDCTILDGASASTSTLDAAPGAPRFNRYAFEGYAVPEAAMIPPAPQPNTFAFELSPSGRVSASASASSSSPASSLLGTIAPPTEVSEDEYEFEDKDKGAPVSGAIGTPIGLGLALPNEEHMFGCSTYTEACTVLRAGYTDTSTLDTAPGTPRFNTFAFEEYAVPEAVPSDQSAPPAPQPNTFGFEQIPAGRITAPSESSSSGSDEYIRRAAALFAGRLSLLEYSMRAHKAIFTSAVNRPSAAAEVKSASIWGVASKLFSAVSAAAPRNESFYVNFVEQFEDGAFGV